jgi:hypothetical protein
MTSTPNLDAALVAAQAEARSLKRDGKNQHGGYKYATSDQIADLGRQLLTKHGLAWSRISTELQGPTLAFADIGNQSYVGDVVIGWKLRHGLTGEQEFGSGVFPIITSKQRPHEKAAVASTTYGCGQIILGLLCWDREDEKHAVDRRGDGDVTEATPDVQPEASAKACRTKVEQLAALTDSPPPDVWALWCERLRFESMQDGGPPTASDLTVREGQAMLDALDGEIRRLQAQGMQQPSSKSIDPALDSAPYLARKGARCGGRAAPLGAEVRKLVGELGEQLSKAWGATWVAVLRKDGAGIPPTVEPEQLLTVDATRLVERLQTAILNIEAKAIERQPGDDADEVPEDDAAELARAERQIEAAFPGTTSRGRGRAQAPA